MNWLVTSWRSTLEAIITIPDFCVTAVAIFSDESLSEEGHEAFMLVDVSVVTGFHLDPFRLGQGSYQLKDACLGNERISHRLESNIYVYI